MIWGKVKENPWNANTWPKFEEDQTFYILKDILGD